MLYEAYWIRVYRLAKYSSVIVFAWVQLLGGASLCTMKLHLAADHLPDQVRTAGPSHLALEFWVERLVQEFKRFIKYRSTAFPELLFLKDQCLMRACSRLRVAARRGEVKTLEEAIELARDEWRKKQGRPARERRRPEAPEELLGTATLTGAADRQRVLPALPRNAETRLRGLPYLLLTTPALEATDRWPTLPGQAEAVRREGIYQDLGLADAPVGGTGPRGPAGAASGVPPAGAAPDLEGTDSSPDDGSSDLAPDADVSEEEVGTPADAVVNVAAGGDVLDGGTGTTIKLYTYKRARLWSGHDVACSCYHRRPSGADRWALLFYGKVVNGRDVFVPYVACIHFYVEAILNTPDGSGCPKRLHDAVGGNPGPATPLALAVADIYRCEEVTGSGLRSEVRAQRQAADLYSCKKSSREGEWVVLVEQLACQLLPAGQRRGRALYVSVQKGGKV